MGSRQEQPIDRAQFARDFNPKHPISRRQFNADIIRAGRDIALGVIGVSGMYGIRHTARDKHEEEAEEYCREEYRVRVNCQENEPVLFEYGISETGSSLEGAEVLADVGIGVAGLQVAMGVGDIIVTSAIRAVKLIRQSE